MKFPKHFSLALRQTKKAPFGSLTPTPGKDSSGSVGKERPASTPGKGPISGHLLLSKASNETSGQRRKVHDIWSLTCAITS